MPKPCDTCNGDETVCDTCKQRVVDCDCNHDLYLDDHLIPCPECQDPNLPPQP